MIATVDRLLDDGGARHQPRQPRLGAHRRPQGEHAVDVVVLLVGVERCGIGLRPALEHRRDRAQPRQVGRPVAAHLQLEPAMAVARHHVLERLGQPVGHRPVAGGAVGRGDRVHQPDRMARIASCNDAPCARHSASISAGPKRAVRAFSPRAAPRSRWAECCASK